MGTLDGKRAIITGGAGGIGRATAQIFVREGARVMLVDLDGDQLARVAADLGDEVATEVADVTEEDHVRRYIDRAVDVFGGVDVLFNNAGITGAIDDLVDTAVENVERVLRVNAIGVFLGLKHGLAHMYGHGRGSIINTSSVAGLDAGTGAIGYVAAKHAVTGMTKAAALEAARHGVRVNSIHPGLVDTEMLAAMEKGFNPADPASIRDELRRSVPLQRYAEPSEIGEVVAFLASDAASHVTGAQYRIDGGMGAHM